LVHRNFPNINVNIIYFENLVGKDDLSREVITPLTQAQDYNVYKLFTNKIFQEVSDSNTLIAEILNGSVAILHKHHSYFINIGHSNARSIQQSEMETVISGPHESFVELASTNLSIIRRRIKSSNLKT